MNLWKSFIICGAILATYVQCSKLEPESESENDLGSILVNNLEQSKLAQEQFYSAISRTFPEASWVFHRKNDNFQNPQFQNSQNLSEIIRLNEDEVIDRIEPLISLIRNTSKDILSRCHRDLIYTSSRAAKQPWAQKMVDSAGKMPSGILEGNLFWPGMFDECQQVISPPQPKYSPEGFKGRYCQMQISVLTIGICIPSSCSNTDFKRDKAIINKTIIFISDFIPFVRKLYAKFPNATMTCLPETETVKYNAATISCIVVVGIFCVVVLLATLLDIYQSHFEKKKPVAVPKPIIADENDADFKRESAASNNEVPPIENDDIQPIQNNENQENIDNDSRTDNCSEKAKDLLLCFSAYRNALSILDCKTRKGQMNCLHGIRFLSLAWVILGHTYVMAMNQVENKTYILVALNSFWFQAIQQATFSVDTFFLLGAFLLTYLFLKNEAPMSAGKWVYFYVHRFIRLTPVYMMMIYVNATWWNYMGDGPFWAYANRDSNVCTRSWWWNLFYINNFRDVNDMCLGWSWYLANDMQFYVISPLFLIPLKSLKHRIVGLGVIVALLLSSWITTGVISTQKNYPIMFNGIGGENTDREKTSADLWDEFNFIYDKPWMRIGPYLIGALLAFAIYEVKRKDIKIHKIFVIVGWISAVILLVVPVYGLHNAHLSIAISAFYNTCARSAWSIGVSWVIFACLTGNGGPVDKLLSWNAFFPLSRLTYCAYLVHPMIMYWYFPIMRKPFFLTHTTAAVYFCGFMCLAYGMAFLVSLVFEAPVIKLEKVLKGK